MAGMTEAQARAILDRVMKLSKAEHCEASIFGGTSGNIRFARNTVTTAGQRENFSLNVQSSFGKRSGSGTANQFDDASIERAVRRSEELARLAPENPEWMPPLGPQQYTPTPAFVEATANVTPEYRAELARVSIAAAKEKNCTAAGFLEDRANWSARLNSAGLFGYHRSTGITYTVSARTADGTGSGWGGQDANDVAKMDGGAAARMAVEKAAASRDARAIEPGKYTVVLEPSALADLLAFMLFSADARQADEGRSFYSKKGGGNKIGEQVLTEGVRIYSDPKHPLAPTIAFDGEGTPIKQNTWIEKGVLKDLFYSRFWAEKMGRAPTAGPGNLIMDGGNASLADLIAGTERGVLVTRFWYIRPLDPQSLLFTGLTRDGLFLIEKGRITRPVKNMRWNESPIVAFNNIEAMTPPERVVSGEGLGSGGLALVCPAARIREFTFSSASDAV